MMLMLNHVLQQLKKLTTAKEENSNNVVTAKAEEDSNKNKVKLITEDNVTFEVDLFIANKMEAVQSLISAANAVVPLPDISSFSLSKIIDYCMEHYHVDEDNNNNNNNEMNKKHLKAFDKKLVEGLNKEELKKLLLAAVDLDVKEFRDFMEQTIADAIKNKSPQFVRDFFGIENDFTPEEEAECRRKNEWAFQNVDED